MPRETRPRSTGAQAAVLSQAADAPQTGVCGGKEATGAHGDTTAPATRRAEAAVTAGVLHSQRPGSQNPPPTAAGLTRFLHRGREVSQHPGQRRGRPSLRALFPALGHLALFSPQSARSRRAEERPGSPDGGRARPGTRCGVRRGDIRPDEAPRGAPGLSGKNPRASSGPSRGPGHTSPQDRGRSAHDGHPGAALCSLDGVCGGPLTAR